jgi:hypothetical protein
VDLHDRHRVLRLGSHGALVANWLVPPTAAMAATRSESSQASRWLIAPPLEWPTMLMWPGSMSNQLSTSSSTADR